MKKKFPHYWICEACALSKGAVNNIFVATCTLRRCEYCKGKKQKKGEFLHPYLDYDYPNDKELNRFAKANRD